jgi:hypothetical protein
MKKCNECGIEKTLNEFHKNAKSPDGLRTKCKVCVNIKQSNYRINNQDKIKDYYRLYIAKNPNYFKEYNKKYYKKSERILLTSQEIKLKKKEHDKKYHIKYPEKRKAKIAVNHLKVDKGYHKHHWSYNKEHYSNIILLTDKQHLSLHKYIKYCTDSFYYKNLDGVLLDSLDKHMQYINELIKSDKI